MKTEAELKQDISNAALALQTASNALAEFKAIAENNRFDTVEDAEAAIEDMLQDKARADCEGSHNCGLDSYTQQFMVGALAYVGTLKCEYNRHDKTYYYVESASFSYSLRDI